MARCPYVVGAAVSVVLLIAAVAILAGVIVVALGRGGELAGFAADVSPFDGQIATAADVALFRPPTALLGYSPQVTDDVLAAIARTLTDRDIEITALRRQIADLTGRTGTTGPLPVRRTAAVPPDQGGTGQGGTGQGGTGQGGTGQGG